MCKLFLLKQKMAYTFFVSINALLTFRKAVYYEKIIGNFISCYMHGFD